MNGVENCVAGRDWTYTGFVPDLRSAMRETGQGTTTQHRMSLGRYGKARMTEAPDKRGSRDRDPQTTARLHPPHRSRRTIL
jgi:hypothetical protein